MPSSHAEPSSSQYEPIALRDDSDGFNASLDERFSSEDDQDEALSPPPKPPQLRTLPLYFSFALALLSAVNIALFPVALSRYRAHPFSESELAALPYGDARVGLDKVAKLIPPRAYHHAWPDRIARVSRKLKTAVWGQGVQVYITVEDSTIMRFPVPSAGANTCAIAWRPPPELSARVKDLTIVGDVMEIEVWQLIALSPASSARMDELNYDTLSYSTVPVRGELLGVLDLTGKPNSTTAEFVCPSSSERLVVELSCQRVACHVSFMQVDMLPALGFELIRRE